MDRHHLAIFPLSTCFVLIYASQQLDLSKKKKHIGTNLQSALHDPSVTADEPSGEHHAKFWQKISPICCLRSHIKKMVILDFRGGQNEFQFLKFVSMNADELQSLLLVPHEGILSSADKVNEIKDEFQSLQFPTGISAVLQVSPKAGTGLRLEKASNLTIDDPFEC